MDELEMELESTVYDLIVLGTGLPECMVAAAAAQAGKTILQLEPRGYYGAQWATLCVREVREAAGQAQEDPIDDPAPPSDPAGTRQPLPGGWELPQLDVDVEGYNESFNSPHVQSQLDERALSRRILVDRIPRLMLSRGHMVEAMVRSQTSHYVQFQTIDRMLFFTRDKGFVPVPCSKGDVFQSKDLSLAEKRMLMKFMTQLGTASHAPQATRLVDVDTAVAADDDARRKASDIAEGELFVHYLKRQKLTASLMQFILYALAFAETDQHNRSPDAPGLLSAAEGIARVQRVIRSLGRFGTTPFLCSMYGSGEYAQAFARLGAVCGATYMIRRSLRHVCLGAASGGSKDGGGGTQAGPEDGGESADAGAAQDIQGGSGGVNDDVGGGGGEGGDGGGGVGAGEDDGLVVVEDEHGRRIRARRLLLGADFGSGTGADGAAAANCHSNPSQEQQQLLPDDATDGPSRVVDGADAGDSTDAGDSADTGGGTGRDDDEVMVMERWAGVGRRGLYEAGSEEEQNGVTPTALMTVPPAALGNAHPIQIIQMSPKVETCVKGTYLIHMSTCRSVSDPAVDWDTVVHALFPTPPPPPATAAAPPAAADATGGIDGDGVTPSDQAAAEAGDGGGGGDGDGGDGGDGGDADVDGGEDKDQGKSGEAREGEERGNGLMWSCRFTERVGLPVTVPRVDAAPVDEESYGSGGGGGDGGDGGDVAGAVQAGEGVWVMETPRMGLLVDDAVVTARSVFGCLFDDAEFLPQRHMDTGPDSDDDDDDGGSGGSTDQASATEAVASEYPDAITSTAAATATTTAPVPARDTLPHAEALDAFAKSMTKDGLLVEVSDPNAVSQAHNDWALGHLVALARVAPEEAHLSVGANLNAEALHRGLHDSFDLTAKGVFTMADLLDALLAKDPDRERGPSAHASSVPEGYADDLQAALQAFVDAQPWRANGSVEDVAQPYLEGEAPEMLEQVGAGEGSLQ